MNVEQVKIESDERGLELHVLVDEDVRSDDQGRLILNIQMVAEELYDEVLRKIGPYLTERDAVQREFEDAKRDAFDGEEYSLAISDEALREQADLVRKAAKENC